MLRYPIDRQILHCHHWDLRFGSKAIPAERRNRRYRAIGFALAGQLSVDPHDVFLRLEEEEDRLRLDTRWPERGGGGGEN